MNGFVAPNTGAAKRTDTMITAITANFFIAEPPYLNFS
jgi:hypothetical protein